MSFVGDMIKAGFDVPDGTDVGVTNKLDVGKLLTVKTGGLTVTAGGLLVTAGGGVITAGDFTITAGNLKLSTAQEIEGSRFLQTIGEIDLANIAGRIVFVAPKACKLISAHEVHETKSTDGGTIQVEKCEAGEAAGSGNNLLATAFTMTTTDDTAVTQAAITSGEEVMAAGDFLRLVLGGNGTSYADGNLGLLLEWL